MTVVGSRIKTNHVILNEVKNLVRYVRWSIKILQSFLPHNDPSSLCYAGQAQWNNACI